jgi:hypothetical protein
MEVKKNKLGLPLHPNKDTHDAWLKALNERSGDLEDENADRRLSAQRKRARDRENQLKLPLVGRETS